MYDLFAKKNINPTTFINIDIDFLCKQLPKVMGISIESLLLNNSLYPIYKPFLHPEMYLQGLNNTICNLSFSSINLPWINIENQYYNFKICPICYEEDICKFGEPYFHRIHQIPDNLVCEIHKIDLLYINCMSNEFFDAENSITNLEKTYYHVNDEFLTLTNNIKKVLIQNQLYYYDNFKIVSKYKQILKQKGFSSVSGSIFEKKLITAFKEYYSKEFLTNLNCDIDMNTNKNWIGTMLLNKKIRLTHPIRHLLFIQFLFGGINEFECFEFKEEEPFGESPWPCLNPCCPKYLKDVIEECVISKDKKNPKHVTGIFNNCPICGMKYSRGKPDESLEDRYRKGKVIEYGYLWDKKFLNSIQEKKISMRELAKIMCCDNETVKNQAIRLNVIDQFKYNSKKIKKNKDISISESKPNKIEEYKKEILSLVNSDSNLSRYDIFKKLPKEIRAVRKNARNWYEENMPTPIPNNNKMQKYTQNFWNEKDKEICSKIHDTIKDILGEVPLKRITKCYINKKIKYTIISEQKLLLNMPMTKKILDKYCETKEQFDNRKNNLVLQ